MPVLQLRCCLTWTFGLLWAWATCSFADEPNQKGELHEHTNALIHSNSPYLLQHAHNPVHWLPWGPEAFARAKAENKPIFVSIGYSTCYWCHVMERESFEDEAVAAILNENYIAIKVDREQRPDIDEQLMAATQLMTGRGGWPNSVWLTADGRPWMAGTYFPREQFMSALEQLSRVYKNEADAVQKQAASLSDAIRQASQVLSPIANSEPSRKPLEQALHELSLLYDAEHGGFGGKPKFPPHGALRLLAYAARRDDATAQRMLTRTLDAMWRGGIHDHVGGGFHRYSTDERWFLPHFEKMLYDNAQLMRSYAEAFELTGDEVYRSAARDIFAWVQREMTHPAGAWYSALDSESAGEEGRFHTWSLQELKQELTEEDAQLFSQIYNFEEAGNFTEEASGKRPGTNIPFLTDSADAVAPDARRLEASTHARLADIRRQLLTARNRRVYPHLDDKILTSWNGLMISALAYAGRVLEEPQFIAAANASAEFLLAELRTEQGLLHTWREGKAGVPGFLDDYAFLTEGLLELHTATGEARRLEAAESLGQEMLNRFEDKPDGGFYFTSHEHEELLVRSKNLLGGGNLPVGNGVAIQVLLQLYGKTDNKSYLHSARRGLDAFSALMLQAPRQVEHLVLASAQYVDAFANRQSQRALSTADDTHRDQAIHASLYLSHGERAAGQQLAIAVKIEIREGYHLYGIPANANDNIVQDTSIRLLPQDGLTADPLLPPKGTTALDPVLNERVTTYAGTIWYYLPMQIAATARHSKREIQVELKYQACDNTRCLAPQTVVLSAPLIVAEDGEAPAKHTEIFERW